MTSSAFTDESAAAEDEPQYAFEGFTVDSSEKIMLTPLGRTHASGLPDPTRP